MARFILDPSHPRSIVLVVEPGSLSDPLARRVVRTLVTTARTRENDTARGAGLLILIGRGDHEVDGTGATRAEDAA